MLYGIINIVCIVWLWRLAWLIGRGTSDHGIGHFWKSFGISCAASAGIKFIGVLLADARTPIESALLNGLLAGLVGMLFLGSAVGAIAWCLGRLFRPHGFNSSQTTQALPPTDHSERLPLLTGHTWKLLGAFAFGICLMALVQTYIARQQPGGGATKMREFTDLLDSLRDDIHKSAIPPSVQKWIAGGGEPSDADPDSKVWIDALTNGIARAAVAAHHQEPTTEDEVSWLQSDRNPSYPETRAMLADYIVTRDPRSWGAFVRRVTESDSQYRSRKNNE